MKKNILMLFGAIIFCTSILKAQNGQPRMTAEERTKVTIEKMEVLKMDAATKGKAEAIMTGFYGDQQKAMEEMRSSGNMDRDAMMAKRKELMDARNIKLKEIFSADQYKQWTNEVEPSIMPQRKQN